MTVLDEMQKPAPHPKGTRIKVTKISKADLEFVPLAAGDLGTVVGGNGVQLWVEFDKGVSVTLIPGIDKYEVVTDIKAVS